MDSTEHMHLQHFCEWRKLNKTIGLHKKEYIYAYTLNIFQLGPTSLTDLRNKRK